MLRIGIVNNMSPAAIGGTERHFRELLGEAAGDGIPLSIQWFRLMGARPANYGQLADLKKHDFDGLIITGCEPKAATLPDEPVWEPLTKTIDWAARTTTSVIFSCLSAHAAVLHLDGVQRHPQPRKIFGLYPAVKVADHPLLAATPDTWLAPHSRYNNLLRDELEANGYQVLADSRGAGVDTFAKQVRRSQFIFFQSHGEYDAGVLMREYRRDVERFYLGTRMHYPAVPANYFNEQITAELEALRHCASAGSKSRGQLILERASLPTHSWKSTAVQMYRNWLTMLLAAQQTQHVAAQLTQPMSLMAAE
ncbi:homoserine O-acetyltransferase/O-succinyltransferase family protein [Rhodopila sp.]|uniref:homoserine O-acetyltransferase/O-succinyltransferase family protein n=1 Tax=Rhodopila sp. TaxID=2480087 RepID=UPI003D0972EB